MREERLLKVFDVLFTFPHPPMKSGEATAIVQVDGVKVEIFVVGSPGSDGRVYAQALDAWRISEGLPGTARYSKEDKNAAEYIWSNNSIGASRVELSVNLNSLRAALLKVEPSTFVGLCVIPGSELTWAPHPGHTNRRGTRYWNLTYRTGSDQNLTSVVTVTRVQAMTVWFWALWFPVGILCTYLYCRRLLRRTDLAPRDLRLMHRKIIQVVPCVLIAAQSILTWLFIPASTFDAVGLAWLDSRNPLSGSTLWLLTALLSAYIFIWISAERKRRFPETVFEGDGEASQPESSYYLSRDLKKKRDKVQWIAYAVLIPIGVLVSYLVEKVTGFDSTPIVMIAVVPTLITSIAKKRHPFEIPDSIKETDPERREKLDQVINQVNRLYPKHFEWHVNPPGEERGTAVSLMKPDDLYLEMEVADRMTVDELAFLCAKEIEAGGIRRPYWLMLVVPGLFFGGLFAFAKSQSVIVFLSVVAIFLAICCFVIYPYVKIRSFTRQLSASALAAMRTNDPAVGQEALRKLAFEIQGVREDSVRAELVNAEIAAIDHAAAGAFAKSSS